MFYIISKNSSNKVTQLYWVIIFIPPIYTQTIVKNWWWDTKESERTTTQTPTLPFTPNPSPKKPKNLKPNTLFLFFSTNSWYIDTYPKNLILEAMQFLLGAATLFFCCSRVAAFGSQDLGFMTSTLNPNFVAPPRQSPIRLTSKDSPRQSLILLRNVASDRRTQQVTLYIRLVNTCDLRTLWSPPVSLNQERHTQRRKAATFIFILFIFCDENPLKSPPWKHIWWSEHFGK
jgi:hypothetical protein